MTSRMLLVSLAPLVLYAALDESPPIGYVVDWRGSVWEDRRDSSHPQPVERGMAVFRDSKLVSKRSDPTYSIEIRSFLNGRKVVFSCNIHPCAEPLNLSEALKPAANNRQSGFFEGLKQVITDATGAGNARTLSGYARALSKGPHGELIDGIAPLTPAGADLTAALHNIRPGEYRIEFCKLAADGASQCPPGDTRRPLSWNSKAAIIPGVSPGLYEIRLFDGDERESAIVLAVPASAAAQAAGKYGEALSNTADWGAGEAALARHAYLEYLNRTLNR